MSRWWWTAIVMLLTCRAGFGNDVLLVVGADGTKEYGSDFQRWKQQWIATCERVDYRLTLIEPESSTESTNRETLELALTKELKPDAGEPLWIVLIGHGTWDGQSARFNLSGPDVSARDMAGWLRPYSRPIILVNCSSSSAPFIERLSGANRVVVTATKSGNEMNFSRFGGYFAEAMGRIESDLDHDDSVSVREAFLKAASDAERFYVEQGRIATEHALLDDNGDKKGSSDDLVRGKKVATKTTKVDGDFAGKWTIPVVEHPLVLSEEQIARRDALEGELRSLRGQRQSMGAAEFREQAVKLLTELAGIYHEAELAMDATAEVSGEGAAKKGGSEEETTADTATPSDEKGKDPAEPVSGSPVGGDPETPAERDSSKDSGDGSDE